MTSPIRPQSAEQIIICEPDFNSKWGPTRNYRLHIKGITIFRGLEANCQWIKKQIETAFAEAYAPAACDETLPVGRQLEVTTTTGMMVSLERWNELQDELLTWRIRTLAALQTIYGLSGQYDDLNEIQAIIDRGEHHLLRPGIPIAISEEDKDWLVPMAHAQKKTLGKFVREKWAETQAVLKLAALPVGESPAAAPQVADEFCLRCGQHFECAKEKWTHDCPVN